MKRIAIIVMPFANGSSYGESVRTEVSSGESTALADGALFIKPGLAVIVRPQYNSDDGLSFYEWRSFNGAPFEKVTFGMHRESGS